MISIIPDIITHKGKSVLLLKFPYNQELINCIKKHPEASWSNTHKGWDVPYSTENIQRVNQLLAEKTIIDFTMVKKRLKSRKNYRLTLRTFL